jgi:hypothetical protein
MSVELVLQMDSGEIEVFNAYRVQHNNSRGPFKGGLRYHQQVDIDDVRRYSVENKWARHSLPRRAMLTPTSNLTTYQVLFLVHIMQHLARI